jgi:hypothetical protein
VKFLGFSLPELCEKERSAPEVDSTPESGIAPGPALVEKVVRYQATDDDLPAELFEKPTELM